MRLDKTQAKRLKDMGTIFMLLLLAILTMVPIFWCVVTSLKTPQDISAYPPRCLILTQPGPTMIRSLRRASWWRQETVFCIPS